MEESYLQSMDPGLHQGRLQDRFQNSSSPSVPGDLFRISSPPTATKVTYSRPPGSGSYHPGSSSPAVHRPLLKTFLCKEARRVDEDNHQLKVSEQVGDVLQVQDGVNKILHSSDPSRCSPLHIGPQGCVLPHPHTSPTPSVLKVCGQVRKGDLSLPVPVPAVRYLICPPPIHKGSIRNDGLPSPEYNYNRALPGRLLADSRLGSKIDGGHPPNLSPIQGLGVDRELPEIRLDTGHKKGIPRHSPGYKNTTLISSREKTDQSETKDRVVQKEENPLDQGSHADPGSDDLLHLNSTLGPIPLQDPPECSFDSLEQRPPFSKLQDENIGKSDKIPVLVDRTRESGERSPVEFDSSHNRHHGRESELLVGGHVDQHLFQGSWVLQDRIRSSNYRELKAVLKTLTAAKHLLKDQHVRILSDNITTVCYLKRQGGTRCPLLQDLADQIFIWAEREVRSISATHLKGSQNSRADFLSRHRIDAGEWNLNKQVFRQVCQLWGYPEIDLFASRGNSQLDCFYSLNPSENPVAVDALAQNWDMKLAYAFPPFPLIPAVLKKMRTSTTTLILVAPDWSKRAWYPILREMSIKDPYPLPDRKDLLTQGPLEHPNLNKLRLTAWILRGKP
ncbi:uncharacterized protein LOC122933830 [Bufo gargarizans]|uniref:uncharacterized protein LOC122933830 n=1 Tax=Bufo gargarizans TaxID=30331 RepID=UPI001CF3757C|nr:uncharacterized protein LOC122933830 [Bufo gargarizans]